MRGTLHLFLGFLLGIYPITASAVPAPTEGGVRMTVNPPNLKLQRLASLRSNREIVLSSMDSEYSNFKKVKAFAPEWRTVCNRRTAAEIALWLGNSSWDKVAGRRAPAVIKGGMKLEDWNSFVQLAFGKPPEFAEVFGRNFSCKSQVTEAYVGYYTRLNGLGVTLKNLNAEIVAAEAAITGGHSSASLSPPRTGSSLTTLVPAEYKICPSYVGKTCSDAVGEADGKFYSCYSHALQRQGPSRFGTRPNLQSITTDLIKLQNETSCTRYLASDEWWSPNRMLSMAGF